MENPQGPGSTGERSALVQLHAGKDLVAAFIEHAALFEKVWQYTPDPMFVLRRTRGELVVDAINPALERRLRRRSAQVAGSTLPALLPPAIARELGEQAQRCLASTFPVAFELGGFEPGGRALFSTLLIPVYGLAGEPRIYGIARNVTALRRTRDALRRGKRRLARRLIDRTRHLQELATRDGLTNAYNRRHFFELATRQCALARRHGKLLSALMLDVDHFKRINDTYGHAVGDRALERVADLCRHALRASDIFGRYGGEEFAVVLPETSFENALAVAEKIRRSIDGAEIESDAGPVRVTVSIGIASCGPEDADIGTVLAKADAALLRAKREGRNRVEATVD